MNFYCKQNNIKKLDLQMRNKRGFALLFSVLISSFLLTIGLSVLSISLKELTISTASRQSIYAIYAAESGYECAVYWDNRARLPPPPGNFPWTGDEVVCGKYQVTFPDVDGTGLVVGNSSQTSIPVLGQIFVDADGDDSGPNFSIEIYKEITSTGIDTVITSTGYDKIDGDRVERSLSREY